MKKKKRPLLAALILLLVGVSITQNASAWELKWKVSLNPFGIWRLNQNGWGGASTFKDHKKGTAWVYLGTQGVQSVYAIARNSNGDDRTSKTLINYNSWEYLENETMSSEYNYYLYLKNAKIEPRFVFADGTYGWDN